MAVVCTRCAWPIKGEEPEVVAEHDPHRLAPGPYHARCADFARHLYKPAGVAGGTPKES